jgi:hypothetical protein
MDIANQLPVDFLTSLGMAREIVADGPSSMLVSTERDGYIFPNASTNVLVLYRNILSAARNESGERSGVSPPVPRSRTGKLTHAARQCSES